MLLHFWTHWPIIFCSGNRDHPFDSTQQQSNCLSMKGNELRELWISFTRLQNAKLTYEGNNKAFWHVVLKSLFKLAQSIIYSEMSKKLLLSKTIEYPSTMFLHTLGFPFNKTKEKKFKVIAFNQDDPGDAKPQHKSCLPVSNWIRGFHSTRLDSTRELDF